MAQKLSRVLALKQYLQVHKYLYLSRSIIHDTTQQTLALGTLPFRKSCNYMYEFFFAFGEGGGCCFFAVSLPQPIWTWRNHFYRIQLTYVIFSPKTLSIPVLFFSFSSDFGACPAHRASRASICGHTLLLLLLLLLKKARGLGGITSPLETTTRITIGRSSGNFEDADEFHPFFPASLKMLL